MQVDAVLTELGNLGTLLVDVDVCIINMGFGCKSICYTFILSVDEEMCAVSRIAEDITFSTDSKCEENVGKSLLQNIDVADFIFGTVKNGANLLVDPAGNITEEQTVDVLDFLNGIKLKQEVGRIFTDIHVKVINMAVDEFFPEQGGYAEVINFLIHEINQSSAQLSVQISMSIDALATLGAAINIEDSAGLVLLHYQLVVGIFLIYSGMERIIFILRERVLFKVIVAVQNICRTKEVLSNVKGVDVVLL